MARLLAAEHGSMPARDAGREGGQTPPTRQTAGQAREWAATKDIDAYPTVPGHGEAEPDERLHYHGAPCHSASKPGVARALAR